MSHKKGATGAQAGGTKKAMVRPGQAKFPATGKTVKNVKGGKMSGKSGY